MTASTSLARVLNTNAYVYVVQARLGEMGLLGGHATGTLSRETGRVIMRFCLTRSDRELCAKGPLTIPVTELLSAAF